MRRQHHRKKELTEVQLLKQENRNLRAENRTLRKQLKQKEKYPLEDDIDDDGQLSLFDVPIPKCPECNKGTLIEVNIVGRNWLYCDQCDYDTRRLKK